MQMRLELVPLPVADVDRSIAFYADVVGFHLDHDVRPFAGMRVVQLTPPGSACSIAFGTGMGDVGAAPVRGLHLVVDDIDAVRDALLGRGVGVGVVRDMGGVRYASFADPDGNTWELQDLSALGAIPARGEA